MHFSYGYALLQLIFAHIFDIIFKNIMKVSEIMTSKQRAYLRGLAQNIDPIFQVGKTGITDNQIEQISNALEARELIKITFLDTIPENKNDIAEEIARRTNSEIVQIIGKKLTLFKRSIKKPKIELP